jgi:heat shock protein HslJ
MPPVPVAKTWTTVVAGVLAIAAAAGCGSSYSSDDRPGQPVSMLWGRAFIATSVEEGGRPVPGTAFHLSFGEPSESRLGWTTRCSSNGGEFNPTASGQLEVLSVDTMGVGCPEPIEEGAEWLTGFFFAGPSWRLDGNHLTLATGVAKIELEEAP